MGFSVDQDQAVRVLMHRFRACGDAHRDRYHAECPDCLLIESNVDRCMDMGHIKDAGGTCLTCGLFDSRLASSASDTNRLLQLIHKLRKV